MVLALQRAVVALQARRREVRPAKAAVLLRVAAEWPGLQVGVLLEAAVLEWVAAVVAARPVAAQVVAAGLPVAVQVVAVVQAARTRAMVVRARAETLQLAAAEPAVSRALAVRQARPKLAAAGLPAAGAVGRAAAWCARTTSIATSSRIQAAVIPTEVVTARPRPMFATLSTRRCVAATTARIATRAPRIARVSL